MTWSNASGWNSPVRSGGWQALAAASGTPFLWVPANSGSNATFANGNRDFTGCGTSQQTAISNQGTTSAKVYCEMTIISPTSTTPKLQVGIAAAGSVVSQYLGATSTQANGGWYFFSGSTLQSGFTMGTDGTFYTVANGDIMMICIDGSNGKCWLGKNGTWSGNPSTEATPWMTLTSGAGTTALYPAASINATEGTVRLAATTSYSAPTGATTLNA